MNKLGKITFSPIGGGREIGANSYLLGIDGSSVLLDCGLHPKKEGRESLPDFSLLRNAPDAVVISHGHVDHCGALPYFLKLFPGVPAFATDATTGIMDCMLHNSVSVMTAMSRERGIHDYPLYTHEDVGYAHQMLNPQRFDREFSLGVDGDVVVKLHHAGHVLGSASMLLRTDGHTLLYTGDICATDQELMAAMEPHDRLGQVDTLVIESTYGANVEADKLSYRQQVEHFGTALRRVLERGECVLIPAFALGRTQEILNIVARLQDSGQIPSVPVYASGLGRAVYEVYNRFPEYLHPDATLQPLSRFGRVGDVWDRENVQDLLSEPCIIVATSGMMVENTPSALIAEEMVQHRKHGIFFVGYVDPDTLGYRVLHAKKGAVLSFGINRAPVKVVLENIIHFHFSAHAPRRALRALIERIHPKNVIFVHGDPEAIDWMYEETRGECAKFCPMMGETVSVEA